MAADQHPLPWRWRGNDSTGWFLEDARGEAIILTDNSSPSHYVRAVTERAKALEQVVRAALPIIARAHDLPADLVPGPVYGAGRALIADIDAAKKEPGNG